MQTVTDVVRRLRSLLNEPAYPTAPASYGFTVNNTGQRFYTDTELVDWINDGCRDIARRTEDLEHISTSISAISGVGNYALPTDTIRVHRLEFQPTGSTQLYPIELRSRNEVDQLIGYNPSIQSAYPWIAWLWGTPGNQTYPLTLSFYPIFTTAGQINVWYFRMPTRLADPVANSSVYQQSVETVEGWDDLIVNFALARAFQKAKNPEWQQRKQEYEAQLITMIEATRQWHNQASRMLGTSERWNMSWLYGFES